MLNQKRAAFKKLLEGTKTIQAPGVYDGVSARIIESLGFDVAYASGHCMAASRLGVPDIDLLSMAEVLDQTRNINNAINIPVVADIDTGYGGLRNVYRTVQSFDKAGVAAIHIEDQILPKKCGTMPGRSVIPIEDMIARIKVALEAREDKDLVIIARTDAGSTMGSDEGKRRLHAYLDAGADLVMLGDHYPTEDMKDIARSFDNKLCIFGLNHDWEESYLPFSEYEECGVKLICYALFTLYSAVKSIFKAYGEFKKEQYLTQDRMLQIASEFWEFQDLVGYPKWMSIEEKYQPRR